MHGTHSRRTTIEIYRMSLYVNQNRQSYRVTWCRHKILIVIYCSVLKWPTRAKKGPIYTYNRQINYYFDSTKQPTESKIRVGIFPRTIPLDFWQNVVFTDEKFFNRAITVVLEFIDHQILVLMNVILKK
jgi:hypothetical protein